MIFIFEQKTDGDSWVEPHSAIGGYDGKGTAHLSWIPYNFMIIYTSTVINGVLKLYV